MSATIKTAIQEKLLRRCVKPCSAVTLASDKDVIINVNVFVLEELSDRMLLSSFSACLTDVLWLVQVVVVTSLPTGDGLNCPRLCFCNAPSRIVYCSRRGLASIPPGVPVDSLQLNLNGNVFESPVMRRANLSSFVDLEHLYLSECRLEALEVGAFANLVALRWLDLSNNRLRAVLPDTFHGLQLQHLFLNGNRHVQVTYM